jgi:hypothetical protein
MNENEGDDESIDRKDARLHDGDERFESQDGMISNGKDARVS